jgi:hypothetical protein
MEKYSRNTEHVSRSVTVKYGHDGRINPYMVVNDRGCLTWVVQEIVTARQNREHAIIITHDTPPRRDTCSKDDQELVLEDVFINDHDADCVDLVRLWV